MPRGKPIYPKCDGSGQFPPTDAKFSATGSMKCPRCRRYFYLTDQHSRRAVGVFPTHRIKRTPRYGE